MPVALWLGKTSGQIPQFYSTPSAISQWCSRCYRRSMCRQLQKFMLALVCLYRLTRQQISFFTDGKVWLNGVTRNSHVYILIWYLQMQVVRAMSRGCSCHHVHGAVVGASCPATGSWQLCSQAIGWGHDSCWLSPWGSCCRWAQLSLWHRERCQSYFQSVQVKSLLTTFHNIPSNNCCGLKEHRGEH